MTLQKKFVQDITQDVPVRQCGTIVFNADNLSNVVSVELYEDGEPVTLGGSAVGAVIRADGLTVPLTGSISGNTASVTLTADCFAVPGQISVGIQIIVGDVKTTVLKAIYNVDVIDTGSIPAGGDTAAGVAELVEEIETATAAIPADYSALQNNVALLNARDTGTVSVDQRLSPNQGSYGNVVPYTGSNTTDYIDVSDLTYILIAPTAGRFAFYDANKTCLSSNTISNAGEVVGTNLHRLAVYTGAVYYRQTANASSWGNLIIAANPIADAFAAMLTPAATLTMLSTPEE